MKEYWVIIVPSCIGTDGGQKKPVVIGGYFTPFGILGQFNTHKHLSIQPSSLNKIAFYVFRLIAIIVNKLAVFIDIVAPKLL